MPTDELQWILPKKNGVIFNSKNVYINDCFHFAGSKVEKLIKVTGFKMLVRSTSETNPIGLIFQLWDYKLGFWTSSEITLQGPELLNLRGAANPDDFRFMHGD